MKGILKFLTMLLAFFGALVGALAFFDKFANKNRIKGDYLECELEEEESEINVVED